MNRNRFMKRLSVLVIAMLAVILTAGLCVTAMASDEMVDPSKPGSITVTIKATDGTVPGGKLNLYQVATVIPTDTGYHYSFTSDFESASSKIDLSENSIDLSTEVVSEELASIVSSKNLTPVLTKAVGSDGTTVLGKGQDGSSTLEVGIYLIIQTDVSDGYSAVNPFVVTVPFLEKNGEHTYDVVTQTKAGEAAVESTTSSTTSTTESTTTTNKTITTHKTTTTTVTARTVKTGDTSNFVLWGVLLVLAALVITIVVTRKNNVKG